MSQVFLYDTTLRDGAQREDLSLSLDDKLTSDNHVPGISVRHHPA